MWVNRSLNKQVYSRYPESKIEDLSDAKYIKFLDQFPDYLTLLNKSEASDWGIDFQRPWELLDLTGDENMWSLEFVFSGILLGNETFNHDDFGFNVFPERVFGKKEFGTTQRLNLTVVFSK